ncbi:hypothetical protein R6Q59_021191 [Mikania micrantha]
MVREMHGTDLESVDHLLVYCQVVRDVWCLIKNWCKTPIGGWKSVKELLQSLGIHKDGLFDYIVTIWLLWIERNNIIFNKIKKISSRILDEIKASVFLWIKSKVNKNSVLDWNSWF